MLRLKLSDELGTTRRARGLSLRDVARMLGVSVDRLVRAEGGNAATLTIDLAARYASILGLTYGSTLYPTGGDAIRDRGHLALLERYRKRLPSWVRWRTEVPVPIAGDLRCADGVAAVGRLEFLVEAETHLGDFQAIERRIGAKARDLGADGVVLLLADTRHNRQLATAIPAIRERFPVDMRTWFRAIEKGEDPGGDALVIL